MHRKKSAAPWPEDRSSSTLFDHLVGAGEQRDRDGDAKRLGFLEVDDQLDLGELLDRQIGRLLALKNAAGVDAGLCSPSGLLRQIEGLHGGRISGSS
jgi:hypothetical protein